jgi:hypothetical protein
MAMSGRSEPMYISILVSNEKDESNEEHNEK